MPKLFNTPKPSEEALSYINKLNIFLAHIPLQDSVNFDYLSGMTSFAVSNYTQILLDHTAMLV